MDVCEGCNHNITQASPMYSLIKSYLIVHIKTSVETQEEDYLINGVID